MIRHEIDKKGTEQERKAAQPARRMKSMQARFEVVCYVCACQCKCQVAARVELETEREREKVRE